jgi:hypothetical protein
MIPKAPKNPTERPETRRNVLFQQESWEIVLYTNRTQAYAVHSCNGELSSFLSSFRGEATGHPPRAVTKASEIARARSEQIVCWSCGSALPDDIVTITELFNA